MVNTMISGEEGVAYVSTFGTFYTNGQTVTAEKLYRLRKNPYGRSMTLKLKNQVFERGTDTQIKVIKNSTDKPDEKLQKKVNKMMNAPLVDYQTKLIIGWEESTWLGKGIFNHVWERQGDEVVLTKLRHLPSKSFDKLPVEGDYKVYSEVLQGIVYNEKTKEVEYWQNDGVNSPIKLDSNAILAVCDPACLELGGEPLIRPLVPILEMLSYTWNTEMQRINRVGAPIMFIKVTNPQAANETNGKIGDIEYAQRILQHWGKNVSFPLRGNMEPVWPEFKESSSTTDVIYTLTHLLIDYCTPIGFVSKEGRVIGKTNDDSDIYWAYTRGQHRWLELAFQPLLDMYANYNGYSDDYTFYIEFPVIGRTKTEIMLRQAELLARTRLASPQVVCEKLEAPVLSDKEYLRIAELYKKILPDPRKLDKDNSILPNSGLINKEDDDLGGVTVLSPNDAEAAMNALMIKSNMQLLEALKTLNNKCASALKKESLVNET